MKISIFFGVIAILNGCAHSAVDSPYQESVTEELSKLCKPNQFDVQECMLEYDNTLSCSIIFYGEASNQKNTILSAAVAKMQESGQKVRLCGRKSAAEEVVTALVIIVFIVVILAMVAQHNNGSIYSNPMPYVHAPVSPPYESSAGTCVETAI